MGCYSIGGTASYFLAAYTPVFFNLLILLMLMLFGATLYITGVLIYKKDTCYCRKAFKDNTASDTQLPAIPNCKIEDNGI